MKKKKGKKARSSFAHKPKRVVSYNSSGSQSLPSLPDVPQFPTLCGSDMCGDWCGGETQQFHMGNQDVVGNTGETVTVADENLTGNDKIIDKPSRATWADDASNDLSELIGMDWAVSNLRDEPMVAPMEKVSSAVAGFSEVAMEPVSSPNVQRASSSSQVSLSFQTDPDLIRAFVETIRPAVMQNGVAVTSEMLIGAGIPPSAAAEVVMELRRLD